MPNAPAIDRVLTCPTLPSLPGVALKVIELTRDRNVRMAQLSEAVQLDPALAAKVLKTVNSSFYGLSTPCPSITRAMTLLGLNTVKSLVLGFTLVDFSTTLGAGTAFDFSKYWRRALFTAAAARSIAKMARDCDAEEAFVGALVSDIGMLACCAALKNEYSDVLSKAGDDHDALSQTEKAALGFTHAEAGMELAKRWRLPPQLQQCIGYHHQVSMCTPDALPLVRCVMLGATVASALSLPDPRVKLGVLVREAGETLKLDREKVKQLVQESAAGGQELAKVMDLRTGQAPDTNTILALAQEQMVETQMELTRANAELTRKTVTDPMTGAANRGRYEERCAEVSLEARQSGKPYSVVFLDADRFKSVNDTCGHAAGDVVLKEIAARMRSIVGDLGDVCRYGGEEFAVLLPGTGLESAISLGDAIRGLIEATPVDIAALKLAKPALPITVSVGVACWNPSDPACAGLDAGAITGAADEALYAAKKSGRNRVCVNRWTNGITTPSGEAVRFEEEKKAEGPGSMHPAIRKDLMIVEDDPLAGKLLEMLFLKKSDYRVTLATSAEKAADVLAGGQCKPALILCDFYMPGMNGAQFARVVSTRFRALKCPVVVMTASPAESTKAQAVAGGATLFISKTELCVNFEQTLAQIKAALGAHEKAA